MDLITFQYYFFNFDNNLTFNFLSNMFNIIRLNTHFDAFDLSLTLNYKIKKLSLFFQILFKSN